MRNMFKIAILASFMVLVACGSEETTTSAVPQGDTEFVVESTGVEAAPAVQVEEEVATEPTPEPTPEPTNETTEEEV